MNREEFKFLFDERYCEGYLSALFRDGLSPKKIVAEIEKQVLMWGRKYNVTIDSEFKAKLFEVALKS